MKTCAIISPFDQRPVGQAVKTLASHAGNMGSIPVRVTKKRFIDIILAHKERKFNEKSKINKKKAKKRAKKAKFFSKKSCKKKKSMI